MFSTLTEAYRVMNSCNDLKALLAPLQPRDLSPFHARTEWDCIEEVEDGRLPDLGYISAARVRQQDAERMVVSGFLERLATSVRAKGRSATDEITEKTRRKMDALLRKFDSSIKHGLFSPLFAADADELEREAKRLAPRTNDELSRIASTQAIGMKNLAHYLAADHMDMYVATSMREDADFVSVNHFVRTLFATDEVRPLKLRYFNPTQSWIDDRIAKGLVEALMLRRAAMTIYMAQKSDSFGKDCEASVALGQGNPVIVYVPKLKLAEQGADTEELFRRPRSELVAMLVQANVDRNDIDDALDDVALVSKLLHARLESADDQSLADAVRHHWADFDLYGEAIRIEDVDLRARYRTWLDDVTKRRASTMPADLRGELIGILVAVAIRFENRAKLFREIHPLALQVILSSGVLNGILVVRSVEQCASILASLVKNDLNLTLEKDESNYRLVEVATQSTVRVISRHQLLKNAFDAYHARTEQADDRRASRIGPPRSGQVGSV
jgi:hypothetical protein